MNHFRKFMALLAASAAGLSAPLHAQNLPANKHMRIIVPYSPGGTSDILARKLAQRLGEKLGRQVIVENKAGAGGTIGTESVVRADADGTTILLHSGAIATEPAIKAKLPYDVTKDLVAVTTVVRGPFALLVSNNLPVKTVPELIAYAKAHPGKVNYGTPGVGTSVHFASEYFKAAAKATITHVPYKGASASLTALMSDEVQVVFDPLATAKKYAEAGKVRALAVTTAQRTTLWPQMPTVSESGTTGFDTAVWYGMYVPARTPTPIVQKLNQEMVSILRSDDMRKWLSNEGLEPVADTPEQSQAFLGKEIERWKALAKSAGIQAE
ncbi:tripartite tricarboxylate transporter substrate binding protein [Cupriavidus pinatubonensis]|uniref:tripartite tricarboxylate transporter substrate binding protein n=1 Tax=Cupriavidus pinatubonensis TaxID=248026 RepID=UPI00112EDFA2|nr:tripartite tricarboxylate transporter substrate binding protein [Cupriavidus pinatubonensis]TPQ27117.1 tripartite tricarboxylate transporter substrate binding protein [Cupriavidus pinatubonensis]